MCTHDCASTACYIYIYSHIYMIIFLPLKSVHPGLNQLFNNACCQSTHTQNWKVITLVNCARAGVQRNWNIARSTAKWPPMGSPVCSRSRRRGPPKKRGRTVQRSQVMGLPKDAQTLSLESLPRCSRESFDTETMSRSTRLQQVHKHMTTPPALQTFPGLWGPLPLRTKPYVTNNRLRFHCKHREWHMSN